MNSAVCDISIVSEVSADDFRNAMRRLTGGVGVITAGRGRDISGMTVTSVTSLSVDPPTLIVSVNRGASSWPLIRRYGFFGVNILNADQLDIAERFTGKDETTMWSWLADHKVNLDTSAALAIHPHALTVRDWLAAKLAPSPKARGQEAVS